MQKLLKVFKKNFLNLIYIFFLGALSSYSLPPYNYFTINFITFSLFFIFLFNIKKNIYKNKNFFKYGWFFGFGYFSFSLYWISISLTFDPISSSFIASFSSFILWCFDLPILYFIFKKYCQLIFYIFSYIRSS